MNRFNNFLKKEDGRIVIGAVLFLPFFLAAILITPQEVAALRIFTPFGGKVESWLPEAEGCVEITAAIAAVTVGTVIPTIEELKVGSPRGGTFGLLKIDGVPVIPFLTNIKRNFQYYIPGTWVLGNAVNVCDVCGKSDLAKKFGFCKIPIIKTLSDKVCDIVAEGCPITNLVWSIGSGTLPKGK